MGGERERGEGGGLGVMRRWIIWQVVPRRGREGIGGETIGCEARGGWGGGGGREGEIDRGVAWRWWVLGGCWGGGDSGFPDCLMVVSEVREGWVLGWPGMVVVWWWYGGGMGW